ncbi:MULTISPECIES: hypothetical protein [unclassified Tenacibaculum]|uniref:hypothetical protein n=1 Tax=unclassified Tenacibaculum TaxID=2635139 RepID=UPI001F1E3338|nr:MULTISPECIES: hypothetical protein [unclassified Tenacibaculum]MCF2875806.1 hypothetical protein [Tenacibaculum sp. Cn5-1]MCF2935881.1 hypothetical protein [Tenacibaculum sp. Cn5-34]MCG7512442.1 hypothetical protein [Tenacibaculum sp. Cn5-46]
MSEEEKNEFNKVLNRGQIFVNFPVMFVMIGLMWLTNYSYESKLISGQLAIIGFIIPIILGWLMWSFLIVKWRIWAFERVDEKYYEDLKDEAIKLKLIWADGHIFEKTEIRNAKERARIKEINDKIEELNNTKK